MSKSLLLINLCHDHKFIRKCGQGESFCRYLCSPYALKTCWRRFGKINFPWVMHLEVFLKTSWSLLEDVLKTCWRRIEEALKTSWKRLEGVLKTSWRRVNNTSLPGGIRPEDVSKTFWTSFEHVLKTSLQDVLKTY